MVIYYQNGFRLQSINLLFGACLLLCDGDMLHAWALPVMHLDTLRESSEDCASSKIVSAEYRKKIQERSNWVSPTEIEFWGCEKLGNQMHRWLQLSILFPMNALSGM